MGMPISQAFRSRPFPITNASGTRLTLSSPAQPQSPLTSLTQL
ncbi:MAG: hypothetical protein AVDCRST_MAG70-1796 [uncultured Thermomicrobiales bacterium]|uniref:Uncharacterized protein n=1 Tax=uncultured Thermomicrobiales bacterium TaxID=1645740 RepID=A0A6J4UZW0_9BACT|nr:MAG: hypothetical protein AVDCRST_MAG70-1796 [uncultured Thermomicrobiales bacterium]